MRACAERPAAAGTCRSAGRAAHVAEHRFSLVVVVAAVCAAAAAARVVCDRDSAKHPDIRMAEKDEIQLGRETPTLTGGPPASRRLTDADGRVSRNARSAPPTTCTRRYSGDVGRRADLRTTSALTRRRGVRCDGGVTILLITVVASAVFGPADSSFPKRIPIGNSISVQYSTVQYNTINKVVWVA